MKPHLEKSHSLLPETKPNSLHSCDICRSPLPTSHLEIALCPNESCVSLFHLTCLASNIEPNSSIVPVKGICPGCKKEIVWDDVIRGVFGRAGQMESSGMDDGIQEPEDEMDDEEDLISVTPRKKRVSGLVRLTGKPRTLTPKKLRTKKGKLTKPRSGIVSVNATDDERSQNPTPKRKPRGIPRRNKTIVNSASEIGAVDISRQTKDIEDGMTVPDSAGEARDVWVISSDDD